MAAPKLGPNPPGPPRVPIPPDPSTVARMSALPLPRKLALAASDIKLAHSVFALPFALLAAFLAVRVEGSATVVDWGRFAGQLALIVVCMVAARTWAMLVNRVADRRFDAQNPRTARRAFASGALSERDGKAMLAASAGAFVVATTLFGVLYANWAPLAFSPAILAWLAFYSFTKRFTALCHIVLGVALALSPLAAGVAVAGLNALTAHENAPALWWLAGMITVWVAGFDVIYALADRDFDRGRGLRSIPAALGWSGAAWVSRALHLLAIVALTLVWATSTSLRTLFLVGVALTAALLITEHIVLAIRRERGLDIAFFTLNGIVSLALGLLGIADSLRG